MSNNEQDDVVLCELPGNAELNKPFRNPKGSGKKFSVYVKNDEGNTVKVSFGDPNMEIRRDDKEARKNFRARHQCDTDPGPKWKARYWSCRMWDDKPVSEITANRHDMETITASFTTPGFDGKAPDAIVFFPKGLNTAMASRAGKPFQVTVNATLELAGILNAQLQQARADAAAGIASRPFIDFGHKKDAASAIPTEIFWDEDHGIMCAVEWTKSGKEAIEGKDFSYFSPEFLPDGDDAAILRIPGPIGGLVNTPAFQNIGVIAANLNNQPSMTTIIAALKKFGVEVNDDADETAVCSALEGKMTQLSNDLSTAKANLASYETKEKEAIAAALASEADSVISAALADGKITDRETWAKAFLASPETVKAQLASIKAKPDGHSAPIVTVTAAAAQKGSTVVCRSEFNTMSQEQRSRFFAEGGKVVEKL